MRAARAENNCVVPTPGVHFSKRAEVGQDRTQIRDECGVSVTREVIGRMVGKRQLLEVLEKRAKETN